MNKGNRYFFYIFLIIILTLLLSACANNVSYIKKGKFVKPNIWEKPVLKEKKLSAIQKKIYDELGPPSYILVYKEAVSGKEKPRKVEEWVYKEKDKFLWFVEGNLVKDIPVQVPGLRKSIFSRDNANQQR
ncbi:MAG: hypothetical protein D6734_06620 [Candidatus Schekmanbacteria bacterium]|nr:MAG: hypothetical protein D6734_06620 [Candidatus Schekmanbacteria bacterium]